MNIPLLSLAVPTYNRPEFLDALLASIEAEIIIDPVFKAELEVLISDNASDSATKEMVHYWQTRMPGIIRYQRNDRNLGGPGNLVAAFEASCGIYTMYIGDDDRLCSGIGNIIRKFIYAQDMPPVCIFAPLNFLGEKEFKCGLDYEALLTVDEAAGRYFFSTGIPGGAAIRTDLAQAALERLGKSFLARTNWPQTSLAFLAAIESGKEQPIAVKHVSVAHVSEQHDANTIYTARIVWDTWVRGLVVAAQLVNEATEQNFLFLACQDIFAPKRITYPVEKVIDHLLLVDDDDEIARFTEEIKASLIDLPVLYQNIPRQLINLSLTRRWLRVPVLVHRKLFLEQGDVVRWPKVISQRYKLCRRLLRYYRHHRAKVRSYTLGKDKKIRDYSREGY